MKQSTFSAVMANSIKNLLQGYTKGIRFTAILTLLFTIGVGQMWGAEETYEKVTSAPSDWSGEYLIVYEGGNVAFNGNLSSLDAVSNTQNVTITNNQIKLDSKYSFTITKSGTNYTIKSASGYYIGQTSNANGLKSSTSTTYSHTISLNTNDKTVNLVSGGAYLRYNSASDQKRFRYYKSTSYTGQKAICLYKKVAAVTTYAVTYDLNGGTGTTPTQAKVAAGGTFTLAASSGFSKAGYSFAGWNDGTTTYNAGATYTMPAKAVTLKAQWTCATPVFDIKIKDDNPVVFSGESIELTVVGSNIAKDATYQWYKYNGATYDELTGQTANKLTIAEATANDAGNYKCRVTNGTCSGENNYTVKMYHIKGLTDAAWEESFEFVKSGDKVATFTIELAATTTYYFKLNDGSVWYWNEGTMTHNNCTDWVIEQEGADTQGKANTGITTTASGTYTFTLNYEDPAKPKLSVTYPQKKMVYLNPGNWNCPNYAVYSWNEDGNSTVLMTTIDDCADRNIYQAEIDASHSNVIFIGGTASYDVANPWDFVSHKTIDLAYPSDDNVLYEINTTHLFLVPNSNWTQDNARFAAYFFGNGETWVSMTKVTEDLYKVTIPTTKTYPSVIFCRMNPSALANNWNNKWNQSADLTITKGKNHYTIEEGAWDKGGGTWKTAGDWTAFTPNYTVTFDANGHGSAPADQCIVEGGKATQPTPEPTATGYTFGGWYKDADCTNAWDFANDVVTSDITLYAMWTINSHTVIWNPNSGNWSGSTANKVVTYEYGKEIVKPADPTRTGYAFAGWSPAFTTGTTMPDNDLTYTAQWKFIPTLAWSANSYTAALEANNDYPDLTTNPADLTGVTYTSSNLAVAKIDANTGVITLVGVGETYITASFAGDGTYASAASATYTLNVVESNCRWVETDIANINSGDEVVITMCKGAFTWTISNAKNTSTAPTANDITDKIQGKYLTKVDDEYKWVIEKNNANLTFYSYSNNANYLYCINRDDGVRIGTGTAKVFVVDGNYLKNTQTTVPRYVGISFNTNPYSWRCYTDTTGVIANETLKFYKRECLDASKVWVEGNLTNVTCTPQLPQQLAKDGSITLTFTAADGYALPTSVNVKMGATTLSTTSWDTGTGKLTINAPTGGFTDNVLVTVEAVELHTITWMVGSTSVLTEEVANATGVTQTPASNPEGDAIGDCADTFLGWSEKSAGSTPQDVSYYSDLCTAAQMKSKHNNVTGDKTFYAVFATAEAGGGENTAQVFATTDIVSSTGVTSGYKISAQASKEDGYYQDGSGDKRYVQVMKSDVSTPMITNTPISITVTAKLGGGSEKNPLSNSVYAIWLDAEGNELGDAVLLTNKITAKTGSDFTANLPIANATSAYGVRVYHQKESGYNVRYYAISLSYKYNDVTYSNYVTQCCTDWTPTLIYSKTTLDSENNETATPTITGNTHNAPVSFESSNRSVLTVDANNGTITAKGAGKATITATWDATGEYCEKSITTNEITVNGNFLVTFHANDGSDNTTTQTIRSNTPTALTANTFQREGYTFQGWAKSANGSKVYDDQQSVTLTTSGLDLYAVWKINAYQITIGTITGNGTITTSPASSANYEAQVTITATPAAHYTLTSVVVTRDDNSQTVAVGGNKFTMPASDVTITAVFIENEKFAINYAIPTGGGTLTDNAPTTIYIDGSITLPGIKDGTISSEYSCEEFIGWTTNPADYEAAGLKPEPFYNTGASFSNVSEDVTFYPVYSRPGAGVGGTITLTAEEMEGWATAQSYGTLRELVTCHGTWKTTGVKSTGNPIQLNATNYVEFPELQGNITQVVLNATNGSNATLTSGTFTLKTLDGQTTIASASVNNSGVCTLTVTGSYKTARLYSSSGTARITNIAITYGPPAIISTTLDCSSDVDECTITYDLNESFLAAGTQILGSCHNSTFKFSEVGTYTICSEPQANEYKLIGWNNQCDGKGSLTYTPGQEITSLPQNIITLYAQWAPEVIVHDSYEETKVYPTEMGGSITLNPGQYICDPQKYEFIGWTTEDPKLWQQQNISPTLLEENQDGTVTFTPTEPSQVYAVYAIEDMANSDAFRLSSNVEGTTYYVGYDANRSGGVRARSNIEDALTFYKEIIDADENKYLLYYIDPSEQDKEYLYYSGSSLSTSNNPSTNNYGWIFHTSGTGYKFQSIWDKTRYLSITSSNVQTNTTGSVFNIETIAEYKYVAKTNCSETVTITFVPGNGTMTSSTNPVTAKTGDVITLPTCVYEGWDFLGWVTENIEITEFEIDPSRLYNGNYEVGNSDITLYAYYTQIPESAEFDGTTSEVYKMYCEVDDKYYYAISHGSSRPGTLPSSNICLNAEEWVFTNTGEANVYYIQDHNNLYLTPEVNNTQLFFTSTPFPWKVVEIGTTNTYRIYAYNTRNDDYSRLIMFQSGAFYHSAKNNEGNSAWHHVTIGGCQNPVYTTDPQPSKIFNLIGSPMITSTINQTVKASQQLQLVLKDIEANTSVTIAGDGLTFYDADNNEVTTLQTGPNGSLTATLTVAYTPTVADNQIVNPAITVTCGSASRTFYNVTCRSLPNTFAIVAKVGGIWYALPSQGLNSTTPPAAYPVEVDNMADPTAVAAVPANADWSLRQVYASTRDLDRFKTGGHNLVFVNNVSPEKALNPSSSSNYLLTNAQYDNYHNATTPGLYEWTPTTTDLETYQLTNVSRTDKQLNIATNTVFGVHATEVVTADVRFLPIQNRYRPMAAQVVEWKENSVVVMYNGDPAQTASVSVNGGSAQTTTLSSAQKDIAVYELAANGLATNPTQRLSITIGTEKVILSIPYIISGETTDLTLLPGSTVAARQEVAKVTDLVVLKGAKLTADGTKSNPYKFRNVTIYGGGKLVIPSEAKGFGVASLTLRAGGITDAGDYDYVYPQFELRGTFTNSADKINYDYITDYDHWYHLVLPFAGELGSITYPTEFYGTNVTAGNTGSWVIKRYAGDIRATGNYKAWVDIETDNPKPTATTPGVGYIFWGAPKKVTVNGETARQKWGIQRIMMSVTGPNAMTAENGDKAIAELSSYANVPNNSGKDNDQGWNLIGNPYMVNLTGLNSQSLQIGQLIHELDASGNWTGKWHWDDTSEQTGLRYVTIPSDHFDTYTAQLVSAFSAANPMVAGRAFFVQIAEESVDLMFTAANRASLMPQHLAAQNTAVEVETGIVLSSETMQDEVNFWIKDGKTNDYEYNADYPKTPNNTNFNIYGVHAHGDLSWVATGPEYAEESMPIGYQVPAAGTYMLSVSEEYYSDEIDALYVTDHEMSPEVTTDLMIAPYEFSVNQAETNNTRFTVSIKLKKDSENDATGLDNININGEEIQKFIYQDKMYILHHGIIYDATGKRVITINK